MLLFVFYRGGGQINFSFDIYLLYPQLKKFYVHESLMALLGNKKIVTKKSGEEKTPVAKSVLDLLIKVKNFRLNVIFSAG